MSEKKTQESEDGEVSIKTIINELIDEIKDTILFKEKNDLNTGGEIFKKIIADSTSSDSESDSDSDSTTHSSTLKSNSKKVIRIKKISSIGDENSSSSSSEYDDEHENQSKKKASPQKYLKTKDEITIDDLPPIEKLNIVLEKEVSIVKVGRVISIVDNKLVVVQSIMTTENSASIPPLDEDTILFDANRKALGKIYETFGPVASPFYSLRFNINEIKDNDLLVGVDDFIYFAPESSRYTKFIFNVDELRQAKGSDASWNHDNEPPVDCIEYSDDEQEMLAKKQLKMKRAGKNKHLETEEENSEDDEGEESEDGQEEKTAKKNFSSDKNRPNLNNKMHMKKSTSFSNRGARVNNIISKSNSHQSFQTLPKVHTRYPNNNFNPYQVNQNQQYGINYGYNQSGPFMPPQTQYSQAMPMQFNGFNQPFYGAMYPTMGPNGYYMPPQMPNQPIYPNLFNNQTPSHLVFNQTCSQPSPISYQQNFNSNFNVRNQSQNNHGQNTLKNKEKSNNVLESNEVIDKRFIQNSNIIKKSF